jgi:hypothetical protein
MMPMLCDDGEEEEDEVEKKELRQLRRGED